MRAYVAFTGPPVSAAATDSLAAELAFALPMPPTSTTLRTWRSPDGRTAVIAWSNEGDDLAWWAAAAGDVRLVTGYMSPVPSPTAHTANEVDAALEQTAGIYSVVHADRGGEINAWNNLPRLEAVYWRRDPDRTAVSNRPLLAHLCLSPDRRPRYDLRALPAFLNTGFHASERTPFEDVQVLPPASRLVARGGEVMISRRRSPVGDIEGERTRDAAVDDVADALLAAVSAIHATDGPIVLTLSGGRDSRLVAAALAASAVPFRATTKGPPEHPDARVAKLVAARLGIEHVIIGESQPVHRVDVERRTRSILRAVDGLLSPYDNVSLPRSTYRPEATANGIGGEALRGGYHRSWRGDVPADPAVFVGGFWLRNERFLTPDFQAAYRDEVSALATPRPDERPVEVLDRLYTELRAGRWSSASRLAAAANAPHFQPLFDDAVAHAARRVAIEDRIQERLIFDLLRRLRPDLLELPLVGLRWRFERDGPVAGVPGWERRVALTSNEFRRTTAEWRRTMGGALDERFRERLLDGDPGRALFDVLDRPALERLFGLKPRGRVLERPVDEAHLLWAAYASAVLLSGDWLEPVQRERPIDIRVQRGPRDHLLEQAVAAATLPRRAWRVAARRIASLRWSGVRRR